MKPCSSYVFPSNVRTESACGNSFRSNRRRSSLVTDRFVPYPKSMASHGTVASVCPNARARWSISAIDGTERFCSYWLMAGCEISPSVFSDSSICDQPESRRFSFNHSPNRYISLPLSVNQSGDQTDVSFCWLQYNRIRFKNHQFSDMSEILQLTILVESALYKGYLATVTQYFYFCRTTVKKERFVYRKKWQVFWFQEIVLG